MNLISDGLYDVPSGKTASVVTHLEMNARPTTLEVIGESEWKLTRVSHPSVDWYQSIFKQVGEPWFWFSRLVMSKDELNAIITHPEVEIYVFSSNGSEEGFFELDFRKPGECELSFFGVTKNFIGKGVGKWLMNHAKETAWSKGIRRFWVHTCTLDGPNALSFYIRSGFHPFKTQVEVADAPRYSTHED